MSKLKVTLESINAIRAQVQAEHPEDTDLLADMMEGETDLHSWLAWANRKIEDSDGRINALKEQMSDRAARVKSEQKKQGSMKGVIMALMNAAGQDKVSLPEATISRRKVAPKAVVMDESALPDEYWRVTRKPDLTAIKRAETLPDGVVMDNGGETISIRRK